MNRTATIWKCRIGWSGYVTGPGTPMVPRGLSEASVLRKLQDAVNRADKRIARRRDRQQRRAANTRTVTW